MALSQYYVNWTTGNDYIGSSFTDGAFTVADMTLTKAGAFVKSAANHWLYLSDNGSGRVTPGYYRIASKTSDNAVVLATSPRSGGDDPVDVVCVQATGAIGSPFRSVQGALDLITRDSTNGDQLNISSSGVQDLSATLSLTTYGTPAEGAPLVLRGYTTSANDGGRGHIRIASGSAIINASATDYTVWVDLDLTGGGNPTRMITLRHHNRFIRCKFLHPGGNAYPIGLGDYARIIGCYFADGFLVASSIANYGVVHGCYGKCANGMVCCSAGNVITGNIVVVTASYSNALGADYSNNYVAGNIVYYTAAHTGRGISLGNSGGRQNSIAVNNIVCGCSGVGGVGIGTIGGDMIWAGHNAFWNNTANYSVSDTLLVDDTANDVQLLADPFVDAANGDFSLTAAAKAALADKGWPGQYLNAHANTDSHLNIGPIQNALPDYPAEDDVQAGVGYGSGAYEGDLTLPAVGNVIEGVGYGADGTEFTGTYHPAQVAEVLDSVNFGASSAETGSYHAPDAAEVIDTATFGPASAISGTYHAPDDDEVVDTAVFGPSSSISGTVALPAEGDVRDGTGYGADGTALTGTLDLPAEADVQDGVSYDGLTKTGTFAAPAASDVRDGTGYGAGGTEFTGTLDLPAEGDVESGVQYDGMTKTGTLVVPSAGDVQNGVAYGNASEFTGTFVAPPEDDVENGVAYGNAGEFTGTFVAPAEADVAAGVGYGAGGTEFTGTYAAADWTDAEKRQIRAALGITGDTAATSGTGVLDQILAATGTLDAQSVRDAMLLAPTGEPADGSIDDLIGERAVPGDAMTLAVAYTSLAATPTGTAKIARYYTWSQGFTSTTSANLSAATKLWAVGKRKLADSDDSAEFFIEKSAGLTRLSGAAYATTANGSIAVSGSSGAWTITCKLEETVTGSLREMNSAVFAIKALVDGDTVDVWSGVMNIVTGPVAATA